MTDFICHFSLLSIFPVLLAFTTTEHASARKSSETYTHVLKQLQTGFSQNYIYLIFRTIISRILNIVLEKYEKKKIIIIIKKIRNEKCLV